MCACENSLNSPPLSPPLKALLPHPLIPRVLLNRHTQPGLEQPSGGPTLAQGSKGEKSREPGMETEVAEVYKLVAGGTFQAWPLPCCAAPGKPLTLSGPLGATKEGKETKKASSCPRVQHHGQVPLCRSHWQLGMGTEGLWTIHTLPFSRLFFYWGEGAITGFLGDALTSPLAPPPEPHCGGVSRGMGGFGDGPLPKGIM